MSQFERAESNDNKHHTNHAEFSHSDIMPGLADAIKGGVHHIGKLVGSHAESLTHLDFNNPYAQAAYEIQHKVAQFVHGHSEDDHIIAPLAQTPAENAPRIMPLAQAPAPGENDHIIAPPSGQGEQHNSGTTIEGHNDNIVIAPELLPVSPIVEPTRGFAQPNLLFPNNNACMKYFMDHSLTKAQAAGIVGNLDQESGANPDQHQWGGGPGYGLAQWEAGGRLIDLRNFANAQHRPISDLYLQLDFMWKEMNTTESNSLQSLRRTSSPAQAADVFERTYERAGNPQMGTREYYANVAFSQYA